MSERGWPDEKENCSETIGRVSGRILKRGDGEFPLEFPIRRKRHIKSDHFFPQSCNGREDYVSSKDFFQNNQH